MLLKNDFPTYHFPKLQKGSLRIKLNMLDTRMLFQIVVDADYSVSAMTKYSWRKE